MIRLLTLSLALGLVGCTPSIKHTSADLNPKTKPVKIKDVTEIFGNYSMIGRNPTDSDMGDYSGKVVIKKGLSDSSVVVEQSIGLSENVSEQDNSTRKTASCTFAFLLIWWKVLGRCWKTVR